LIRRNKHRDKIQIICDILQLANGRETKKIKIMHNANLSYGQSKQHLMFLIDKDLLRYDEDTRTYKTTEKGIRFLQIYDQIDGMIKEVQLPFVQQQMWI